MNLFKILLFSSLFISLGVSCTRKVDSVTRIVIDGSSLQSKTGSLAYVPGSKVPGTVLINLDIAGQTEVQEFHCSHLREKDGDPSLCSVELAGHQFEFASSNIVAGAPVELQVLVLMDENEGDTDVLFYGKKFEIAGGVQSEQISISSDMTLKGTVVDEAHVKGRFVSFTGAGATDDLEGYAHLDTNYKPMKVTSGTIASGWFSVFFVDVFPFTYQMKSTGQKVFDNVSLSDLNSYTATDSVRAVQIPRYFRYRDGNQNSLYNDSDDDVDNKGDEKIFFAYLLNPGSLSAGLNTSYKIDYSASDVDLETGSNESLIRCSNYAASDSPYNTATGAIGATCSYPLKFNPVNSGDGTTGQFAFILNGFSGDSCSSASGGPIDTNCMDLDMAKLSQGGRAFFNGVFQQTSSGYLLHPQPQSGHLQLDWKFLPDVGSVLGGMEVFLVHSDVSRQFRADIGEGYQCDLLSSSGFPSFETIGGAETINVPEPGGNSDDFDLILCPFTGSIGSKYYLNASALDYELRHLNGSGGGSPTKLRLATVTDPSKTFTSLNAGACITLELAAVDNSDRVQGLSSTTDIRLTFSGELNLYDDMECTGSSYNISNFSTSNGHFHKFISFKAPGVFGSPVFIEATTVSGDSLTLARLDYTSVGSNTADSISVANFGRGFGDYNCTGLKVYSYDSSNNAPAPTSGATNAINLTDSGSGADFWWLGGGNEPFGLENCTASAGSSSSGAIILGGSGFIRMVSANATGRANDSFTISATEASTASLAFPVGTVTDSWTNPGPVSHIDSESPIHSPTLGIGAFRTGLCLPFDMVFWDNEGNRTIAASEVVTMNHDGHIRFFSDDTCSNEVSTFSIGTAELKRASYIITSKADFNISFSGESNWRGLDVNSGSIDHTQLIHNTPIYSQGSGCVDNNIGIAYADESNSLLSSLSAYWASSYGSYRPPINITGVTDAGLGTFKDSCAGSIFTSGAFPNTSNEFNYLTFDPTSNGGNISLTISAPPGIQTPGPYSTSINP